MAHWYCSIANVAVTGAVVADECAEEMQNTLDNRLAASAKMLMSLMSQYDLDPLIKGGQPNPLFDPNENLDLPPTLACKVANVAAILLPYHTMHRKTY